MAALVVRVIISFVLEHLIALLCEFSPIDSKLIYMYIYTSSLSVLALLITSWWI